MYWGCFKAGQVGPLVEVGNKLNGYGYLTLLENNLDVDAMHQNNTILQQDNAPIHKAACVTNWLQQQGLVLLDWPQQSPDLNPIENVWSHIKAELDKLSITSKAMLRIEIQQIWRNIEAAYLENLIDSMPRRVAAVIRSRGGFTNY